MEPAACDADLLLRWMPRPPDALAIVNLFRRGRVR